MATELGTLDSITRLQIKLAQQQNGNPGSGPPGSWMQWTTTRPAPAPAADHQEDDSWEVRAFAEDTGSIMGTTWPPRSYTCNFCRREFRSAQALGGHMNVHRRDRARLRQSPPSSDGAASSSSSSAPTGFFPVPHQQDQLVANGAAAAAGLCLLYPFPNQRFPLPGASSHVHANSLEYCASPSTLLSISPYDPGNGYVQPSLISKPQNDVGERVLQTNYQGEDEENIALKGEASVVIMEELDLELRLGNKNS